MLRPLWLYLHFRQSLSAGRPHAYSVGNPCRQTQVCRQSPESASSFVLTIAKIVGKFSTLASTSVTHIRVRLGLGLAAGPAGRGIAFRSGELGLRALERLSMLRVAVTGTFAELYQLEVCLPLTDQPQWGTWNRCISHSLAVPSAICLSSQLLHDEAQNLVPSHLVLVRRCGRLGPINLGVV